jgi:peptidyl-tRNA hydrolase, PTH1 family
LLNTLWHWLFGAPEDPLAQVPPGQAKLIVGLGNPGPEYAGTRHNVGFQCVDLIAERLGARWLRLDDALVAVADEKLVLAKPLTFMNRSGPAVARLLDRRAVPTSQALVIYDDMDLPLGTLRLRARGSAGTHNGMRSVIAALGTEHLARLRIGIGQASPGGAIDHVLSGFTPDERPLVQEQLERAADAGLSWANEGAEVAMNRYNR